jgi:hypothetical protein
VIYTDRCFHIENFPLSIPQVALGAPDEVMEA